jgi:hypothetical protein
MRTSKLRMATLRPIYLSRSKLYKKWLLQAKPQRDLNPTTRCWHSWLLFDKNKMRSESPSNQLPEHIHPARSAFYRTRHLERNAELGISFHIFDQDFLPTAIIQLCRPTIGMTGNPLCHFKRSSILQEIRYSGSPKRMGRECIRQPGVFEPAFEHSGCIDSGCRAVPKLSRLT